MLKKKVIFISLCVIFAFQGRAQISSAPDMPFMRNLPLEEKGSDEDAAYWNMMWYFKLAEYGDPKSQFVVARAYEKGQGIAVNLEQALRYYKLAAQNHHDEAAMRLGAIYAQDSAWGEADPDQALFWYEYAAQNNYVPAQLKVSALYEARQEYQKSYDWMARAVRILFPKAKDLEAVSGDLVRLKSKIKGGSDATPS